jgi:hypothetical protein
MNFLIAKLERMFFISQLENPGIGDSKEPSLQALDTQPSHLFLNLKRLDFSVERANWRRRLCPRSG